MNTESICTRPCLQGWDTSAAAAALGAEPMPASLEYRPRLKPYIRQEPIKPPKMALKLKASAKIMANMAGRLRMLMSMAATAMSTYSTPMTGTTVPVTFTMRRPPPRRQYCVTRAMKPPMMAGIMGLFW